MENIIEVKILVIAMTISLKIIFLKDVLLHVTRENGYLLSNTRQRKIDYGSFD